MKSQLRARQNKRLEDHDCLFSVTSLSTALNSDTDQKQCAFVTSQSAVDLDVISKLFYQVCHFMSIVDPFNT